MVPRLRDGCAPTPEPLTRSPGAQIRDGRGGSTIPGAQSPARGTTFRVRYIVVSTALAYSSVLRRKRAREITTRAQDVGHTTGRQVQDVGCRVVISRALRRKSRKSMTLVRREMDLPRGALQNCECASRDRDLFSRAESTNVRSESQGAEGSGAPHRHLAKGARRDYPRERMDPEVALPCGADRGGARALLLVHGAAPRRAPAPPHGRCHVAGARPRRAEGGGRGLEDELPHGL